MKIYINGQELSGRMLSSEDSLRVMVEVPVWPAENILTETTRGSLRLSSPSAQSDYDIERVERTTTGLVVTGLIRRRSLHS